MPENHRKYLHYNAEDFTAWANTIGSATAKAVHYFLTRGKEPEQGYKACASLTKLGSLATVFKIVNAVHGANLDDGIEFHADSFLIPHVKVANHFH